MSFISEKTLSVAALVPGRLRQNSTILKTLAQGISLLLVEVRKQPNPSFVDCHVLTLPPCACFSSEWQTASH